MKKKFNFINYFKKISELLLENVDIEKKLILLKKKILLCKKNKKKVIIFGNGGSSAIASHFTIDLTNAAGIRCVNFSDSSLITCLANDYGYENWVKKAIESYADSGDVLILISSSGMSKNITTCIKSSKIKFSYVATFSGFKKNNDLNKIGNLNFWVNSKSYNVVENIHQIWLLSLVDSIIG